MRSAGLGVVTMALLAVLPWTERGLILTLGFAWLVLWPGLWLWRDRQSAHARARQSQLALRQAQDQLARHATLLADVTQALRPIVFDLQSRQGARIGDDLAPSTAALCRLSDNLAELATAESGHIALDIVAFDLPALLDRIGTQLRPMAEQRGLKLGLVVGIDLPHRVMGDPRRIEQALTQLLHNALAFTPQGQITLRCIVVAGLIRFAVEDTGIGIAEIDQPRLFQRFARLEPAAGGHGLGLALAKALVERMGGRIGVTSQQGAGAQFWFELPLPLAQISAPLCPMHQLN